MTARLARFTNEADGESYRLEPILDDGTALDISASFDQLDQTG